MDVSQRNGSRFLALHVVHGRMNQFHSSVDQTCHSDASGSADLVFGQSDFRALELVGVVESIAFQAVFNFR